MYSKEQERMIEGLYAADKEERLRAAAAIGEAMRLGTFPRPETTRDVNNHIHTIYSFSPYSPSAAVFKSVEAGLATCGLMDHDSIGGSEEFFEVCRLLDMAGTQGCELRCSFAGTALEGRRINNPDQVTMAYVALHAIPRRSVAAVRSYLEPIRAARLKRNVAMVARLNEIVGREELALDFDRDVRAISCYDRGGEITERHILYALARKLIHAMGRGPKLRAFLENELGLPVSEKQRAQFDAPSNPYYDYDLLGLFKAQYVAAFFIPAADECVPAAELAEFAREHGICLAYAYLGDVGDSVTGDKKTQKFEDDFLDELFPLIKEMGFRAVTYMPSRNTEVQMKRVMDLCEKYNLYQISGEDINQPRQKFVCEALRKPEFAHLYDMAWALIGHEAACEAGGLAAGILSAETETRFPDMQQRIAHFRDLGLNAFEIQKERRELS